MRKLKSQTVYSIVLCTMFLFVCLGCSAKSKFKSFGSKKILRFEINDSLVKETLGDSILSILNYGKVKSMLIEHENGETVYKYVKVLSNEERFVLSFIMTDPYMVSADLANYGIVIPCIRFEFQKTKAEKLYVNFDFGLRKWTITDADDKILKQFAIARNDMLRFCYYLYPQNNFIENHYKETLE